MKKFNKAIIAILLLAVIMVAVLTGCTQGADTQVVKNHNFEITDDENTLETWEQYSSEETPNVNFTQYDVPAGSVESETLGTNYTSIEITEDYGVAYYTQNVKLYSGVYYHFAVDYNITSSLSIDNSDKDSIGAYFGFLEDVEFLDITSKKSTNGWNTREAYFVPNRTATYTLVAGIGREDLGGARGKVSFDNISIMQIDKDAVPAGSTISTLSPTNKYDSSMAGGIAYTVIFTLFGAAILIGAFFAVKKIIKKEGYAHAIESNVDGKTTATAVISTTDDSTALVTGKASKLDKLKKALYSPMALFIYVLTSAFAIRFIFLMATGGFVDDMTRLGELALLMADEGMSKAYTGSTLLLPSGMLYIVYLIGLFTQAVGIPASSLGMSMLLRIPNVIADIFACYLIFIMLSKHYNYKISAVFAGTYAVLPTIFMASTTWGMGISIPIVFILLMFMFLMNKNLIGFNAMFALALLFSYSSFILLPLVLALDVYYCVLDKKFIIPVCVTAVIGFAVYYSLALPFAWSQLTGVNPSAGGLLVFTNILNVISQNTLITNSSFNFFAIFGLGQTTSPLALTICVIIVMIILAAVAFYMFYQSNNRTDALFLAAMSFIVWSVFGVGAKMENMVIGIALLFVYATLKTERRLYIAAGILAVAMFVNMAVLQTNSGYLVYNYATTAGFKPFHYTDPLYIIGSIIVTFTTLYLFYVSYDIMIKKSECDITPMSDHYITDVKNNLSDFRKRNAAKFKRAPKSSK